MKQAHRNKVTPFGDDMAPLAGHRAFELMSFGVLFRFKSQELS